MPNTGTTSLSDPHPRTAEAHQLFFDSSILLARVQQNGIRIDVPHYRKAKRKLEGRIARLTEKLEKHKAIRTMKRRYGSNFNLDSSQQLSWLVYNHMGKQSTDPEGKKTTSAKALKELKLPFADDLIDYRRNTKALSTYVEPFLREEVDGYIHSFYKLYSVVTFRGSCSQVNFQNIPIRIPWVGKLIRGGIIPRKGRCIVEFDYSGQEVRVSACYHRDPRMIREIEEDYNFHGELGCMCYTVPFDLMTKDIRYGGKNGFVFPQFYGNMAEACAKDLWDHMVKMDLKDSEGTPVRDHLKRNGIRSYGSFVRHIEKMERYLWHERYPTYYKWKRQWYDRYLKNGYVDMKTGFRCAGVMKRTEVINYAVQGAAFHCLLKALLELQRRMDAKHMSSLIIGQIHDSVVADVAVEELPEFIAMAKQIFATWIGKQWDWLIVPLDVDVEICDPDEPGSAKHKWEKAA